MYHKFVLKQKPSNSQLYKELTENLFILIGNPDYRNTFYKDIFCEYIPLFLK